MSFPVVFIDYANDLAEQHWAIVEKLAPWAQRIDAVGPVEQSIKVALNTVKLSKCWIVSSHCDYSDFDFNFVPSKYDQKYLHIWASPETRFGETFLFPSLMDPWDSVTDLPIKYMDCDIHCQWDLLTWIRTGDQWLDDLCRVLGQRKGRVLFQHANSTVEFNLENTVIDYKPKLVHLEDSDSCFTFLSDAAWLKELQLLETDLDTVEEQIVVKAARRTVSLPIRVVTGSNVLRWIDLACEGQTGWIVVSHNSVTKLEDYIDTIWDSVYQWGREEALHAYGHTCAMVFAVNVEHWRSVRVGMETIFDHPCLITHPTLGVQDPRKAVTVRVKDFVNKFDWTPQNWDDMQGPVALVKGSVLLGVAGDDLLITELELLDEDPWQWPNLRIVEINAKVLNSKRNLFDVKR